MAEELLVIYADVSQGDCTFIFFPKGQVWMIDCGTSKNPETVRQTIRNLFNTNSNKFRKDGPNSDKYIIDVLILTHPDGDHYNLVSDVSQFIHFEKIICGGSKDSYAISQTLENYEQSNSLFFPDNVYRWVPPLTDEDGDQVMRVDDGAFEYGGTKVCFLAANFSDFKDSNKDSIVLSVNFKENKFFFMGDAPKCVEKGIIENYVDSDVLENTNNSILKLGHHGSAESSSENWIQAIRPNAVFISNGTMYNMPTHEHLSDIAQQSELFIYNDPTHYFLCRNEGSFYTYFTNQAIYSTTYSAVHQYTQGNIEYWEDLGCNWYATVDDNGDLFFAVDEQDLPQGIDVVEDMKKLSGV